MIFKPLPHAPWINNAVVDVSENFNLSVSYNNSPGMWYVGDKGHCEVAIQAGKPNSKYRSLVSLPDNEHGNIYHNCDKQIINQLIIRASELIFDGEILVFDDGLWKHRFYCAKGFDRLQKESYCRSMFKDNWQHQA